MNERIAWLVAGLALAGAAWLWRRDREMRRHVRIALGIASAATAQLHDYEEGTPAGAFEWTTDPEWSIRYWLN